MNATLESERMNRWLLVFFMSVTLPGCRGCPTEGTASSVAAAADEPAAIPPTIAPVERPIDPAVAVAVGSLFSCALRRSGALWCWGADPSSLSSVWDLARRAQSAGGPGQELKADENIPRQVAMVPGGVALFAADDALCALTVEGAARCWRRLSLQEPEAPPTEALTTLDVRGRGSCGVTREGQLRCWDHAALGIGSTEGAALIEGALDVALSATTTCAARARAPVACWPPPRRLRAGGLVPLIDEGIEALAGTKGVTSVSGTCVLREGRVGCFDADDKRRKVEWLDGLDDAEEIASSDKRVCALRRSGAVACRGLVDARGWQGVPTLDDAVSLAVGDFHACALRMDGGVACWGENSRGELGDGKPAFAAAPGVVVPGVNASALGVGGDHACVVEDGKVLCWGSGREGQIGEGERRVHVSPVEVPGITDAVDVAAGLISTCARVASGAVFCWGGATGRHGSWERPTPIKGVSDAVDLDMGTHGVGCARQKDGATSCWSHSKVRTVSALQGAEHLAMDNRSLCFAREGVVSCAERGFIASLSSGREVDAVVIDGLVDVRDLDNHDGRFCALTGDRVSCWRMRRGAVGRSELLLGEPATSIAVSGAQICALGVSRSVWCGSSSGAARRVEGLDAVTAIDAGVSHICARREDGSVRCWGSNARGQLGEGGGERGPVAVVGMP